MIAVTAGDPAGIGPEITLKALQSFDTEYFAVYCSKDVLEKAMDIPGVARRSVNVLNEDLSNAVAGDINIVDVGSLKADSFVPGQCSAECASAAYSWVERAVRDSQRGLVSVIATAPVNKVSLRMAGIPFTGHTEMFAHLTGVKDPLTMFQVDNMRIFFLSRHVSLSEAIRMVTYERLMDYIPRCIRELDRLGVKGTLAVAALNPHAGDGGQFGTEERIIHRAVCDSRKAGLDVCGPIGADSVFHQALCGKYSAVLSLYHDQGHIAAKTYDFNRTVSLTLSMDVLRVSVDHGTAFDIAWKGLADETGMKETLRLALVHSS